MLVLHRGLKDTELISHNQIQSIHSQRLSVFVSPFIDSKFEISVQNLPIGMYYLLFYNERNQLVGRKKFVKIDYN